MHGGGVFIVAACAFTAACLAAWQENVRPKMYVQLGEYPANYYALIRNYMNINVGGPGILFVYHYVVFGV